MFIIKHFDAPVFLLFFWFSGRVQRFNNGINIMLIKWTNDPAGVPGESRKRWKKRRNVKVGKEGKKRKRTERNGWRKISPTRLRQGSASSRR
jgi:hypothetical protein